MRFFSKKQIHSECFRNTVLYQINVKMNKSPIMYVYCIAILQSIKSKNLHAFFIYIKNQIHLKPAKNFVKTTQKAGL